MQRQDTSCKAVSELLRAASQPSCKLEVVRGTRGGLRLSVIGMFDLKLNLLEKNELIRLLFRL